MTAHELFRLDGQVAVVTGGGHGLGAAAARGLADAGATVIVAGRREGALEASADKIRASGGTCHVLVLDVTDPDAVSRAFARVADRHGGMHVLVNNAGTAHQARALDTEPEAWQRVLDVNLNGTFYCAQAFARLATDVRLRSVINVASIASAVGVRGQSAYAASKSGVLGLTRSLALELVPRGIRVNALAPGYFRTDMPAQILADPVAEQKLLRKVPMGRIADPEEIVGPIVFLASSASSFLTGATLYYDGGYTAQ